MNQLSCSGSVALGYLWSGGFCICVADAIDPDHPLVYVSEGFTDLTGYPAAEVLGRNGRFLQGPRTDRATIGRIRGALHNGAVIDCEILNYRRDGSAYLAALHIDPMRDRTGRLTHFVAYQIEIDRHADLQTSPLREDALSEIIENLPGYFFRRVMLPNQSLEYPYLSRSLFRILGLPDASVWNAADFIGHIHPDDRDEFLRNVIHSGLTLIPSRAEFRLRAASGEYCWFRSDSKPRAMTDSSVVWEGLAVDITAEKRAEFQLGELARHDILTGLANRLRFQTIVENGVARPGGAFDHLAIFTADLDDFSAINEEWGPKVGDRALQVVGERLADFAQAQGGAAARVGGDRFGLMLALSGPPEEIMTHLRETLRAPMELDGRTLDMDVCIGAALNAGVDSAATQAARDRAAELIKRSDFALQRAKQAGPGTCLLYSAILDDRVALRMALRASLRQGVAREQFQLHYQPLVDLRTGAIVGAEALVRWNHPELGLQRPDLFIPYAESSGLIVPLGAWVISEAMRQSSAWRQQGLPATRLSINLSSVQLQRPGLLQVIEQALATHTATPADFDFELTEASLLAVSPDIITQLSALRSMGFGLAVDDFGTGYSTFRYLRDFPVSKVKIDQTFIRQLVGGSSDETIVRAMIALADSLRLGVIAEGVETVAQRALLQSEGCQTGQGYLFSPPLCAEDFAWLLQQNVPLPFRQRPSTAEAN